MSEAEKSLEVVGVACQNCVGACCRAGAAMELTDREVYNNRRQMQLERVVKARDYPQEIDIQAEGFDGSGRRVPVLTTMTIPRNYGLYLLEQDCGHLTEDNQCRIYGEARRPRACANYEMGGAACLGARQAAGLIELEPPSPKTSD